MALNLAGPFNSGAAVGGDGAATANATSSVLVSGAVLGVYVRYNDSPPATTDVTVATAGNGTPSYNIIVLTDASTDGIFLVRDAIHDTAGDEQATNFQPIPVHDQIKVTIAGANAGDSADVWLLTAG